MKIKQLQKNWREVELEDIATVKGRIGWKGLKSSEYVSKGYPIITSYNLVNIAGGMDYTIKINRIPKWRYDESPDIKIKNKDILMSKIEGRVGFVENLPEESTVNSTITIIRIKDLEVSPKFIYYFFKSSLFKSFFKRYSKGTTMTSINHTSLKKMKILLPSLEIQKIIVSKLDKAEQLKQKREEAIYLFDEYLKGIFISMFGNPLSNEKKWEKIYLTDIGEIITGNTPPRSRKENYGDYIEWIKSDNLNVKNIYLTKSKERLSKEGCKIGRIAPKGSVLVTCIAGSISCIGNTGIADRDVAFNQQINAIVPNKRIDSIYLYFLINNHKKIIQNASTKALKGIVSKSSFSKIKIPVPTIKLQKEFSSMVKEVEKLKEKQNQSKKEIDELFDSLMRKAFAGELI